MSGLRRKMKHFQSFANNFIKDNASFGESFSAQPKIPPILWEFLHIPQEQKWGKMCKACKDGVIYGI